MKKKQTQKNTYQTPAFSLATKVLNRIEDEKIMPKGWWKFACTNCLVWIAWFLTVFVGAVSVSVLFYVNYRSGFELFEATHNSYFSFLLEALPLLWVLTFVVMLLLAYFNIRMTKCGYRYPLWKMFGSSMFISIVAGILLHLFGVGYAIDTQFAKIMPAYTSFERMEMRLWQMPEEGRLVGRIEHIDYDTNTYTLRDANKKIWTIMTRELDDRDKELLQSGSEIRIVGTTTTIAEGVFYACGVFPLIFGNDMDREYLAYTRRAFEERMYTYTRQPNPTSRNNTTDILDALPVNNICSKLRVVHRMKN